MSDITLCAIEETFPGLKHLVLTTFSMEHTLEPENGTMTNLGINIEHLTLKPPLAWRSYEDQVTFDVDKYLLRYHKSLKTFDLHVKIARYSSTIVDLVCDALSGIRGDNILQKMELIFFYDPPPLPISEKLVLDLEHWRRFAALITGGSSSFPALRHISLHIALQEQPAYGPGYTADRAELAEFRNNIDRTLDPIMCSPHITFRGTVKLHRGSMMYCFPDNFNDY
ncbi:hypothetical protein BJ165DRAFT_1399548 [Panaeolus papilionaceus]|nr:hypothetical protein BJ165DRAFT_1399548 [Panaeolus papilionaceus]